MQIFQHSAATLVFPIRRRRRRERRRRSRKRLEGGSGSSGCYSAKYGWRDVHIVCVSARCLMMVERSGRAIGWLVVKIALGHCDSFRLSLRGELSTVRLYTLTERICYPGKYDEIYRYIWGGPEALTARCGICKRLQTNIVEKNTGWFCILCVGERLKSSSLKFEEK